MKPLTLLLLFFTLYSCHTKQENITQDHANRRDTFTLSNFTIINDLPDSLMPKTINLDERAKPLTVNVPTHSGGGYSVFDMNRKLENTIKTEPPLIKQLPVITDSKGKVIKDAAGNSFLLGNGGLSNFKKYSSENGLAIDAVACSMIDRTGNLWFGTWGAGVSRFDGRTFTTFSVAHGLPHGVVRAMVEDNKGNIWFGTQGGGVSCFDGKSFTNYSTRNGLPHNIVLAATIDRYGTVWFGTSGGLCRFDTAAASVRDAKLFTTITKADGLSHGVVFDVLSDKAGKIWFGTPDAVYRFDPNIYATVGGAAIANFTTSDGLASSEISSIVEDNKGNIWFGTSNGLSRYTANSLPGRGYSFTNFTTAQGLPHNFIICLAADSFGNVWVGTEMGLAVYRSSAINSTRSQYFTSFRESSGFIDDDVRSIKPDRAGNIWLSTSDCGVYCYYGDAFTNFTAKDGLSGNTVRAIGEDNNGGLWIGNWTVGALRFDGRSFSIFQSAQGSLRGIYSISTDKNGNVWFGHYDETVRCFTPPASQHSGAGSFTWFNRLQGFPSANVHSSCRDNSGNMWFGTYGSGVYRFDGKTITFFTKSQGLADDFIYTMICDKTGNLWLATAKGVSRFDGKSFISFSIGSDTVNKAVYSIAEDSAGNLWFCSDAGLSVMASTERRKLDNGVARVFVEKADKTKKRLSSITSVIKIFSSADGLPYDGVSQILQLPDGSMIGATVLGIVTFSVSEDLSNLSNITHYNTQCGYPVKEVNCMFLDSKGILWIGTQSKSTGLVRFNPSARNLSKNLPVVLINSIQINDEKICWYNLEKRNTPAKKDSNVSSANITEEILVLGRELDSTQRDSMRLKFADIEFEGIRRFNAVPEHLVIPYRLNKITIDFNAIEPSHPDQVSYSHMLEGYDKDWSPEQKNTSVTFGNIQEGNYTFKVKAKSANGLWTQPTIYTFRVLPPWYRTWLAYGIYSIVLLLTGTIFIRWRERNLLMEKKKLEQIVEIRTAEVVAEKKEAETALTTVSEQKAIIERKNSNILSSIKYAKRIQQAMLPPVDEFIAQFNDSFFLYQPRDIVSGDFYWMAKREDKILLAVADCTGHGVPGAFMSLIGFKTLDKIVYDLEIHSPDMMLAELRAEIKKALNSGDASSYDAMDISVISLDYKNGQLQRILFSGAINSLITVSDGEITVYKGDRLPIGGEYNADQNYTLQDIPFQNGTWYYLTTDGFQDQLGGKNKRKFGSINLHNMLNLLASQTGEKQKEELSKAHKEWIATGNTTQTDDITIVGFRLS